MEIFSYIRIAILLISAAIFFWVTRQLGGANIRGLREIAIGISLIVLNYTIRYIFQALSLPEEIKGLIYNPIRFFTRYIGLPFGLTIMLIGIYRSIRSLLPHLQLRYAHLVDSLNGIVWEADADTLHFTFVSKRSTELLGYTPEKWLHELTWKSLVHPEDVEYALIAYTTAIREKKNINVEFRVLSADGRIVWVRNIATVVVEKNNAAKLCGVLFDITPNKQTEESLQTQKKLYETILKAQSDVGEGFLIVEGTKIVHSNQAFQRMSGYSAEELTTIDSFFDLIAPEERLILGERYQKRIQGELVRDHYESAMIHKDGRRVNLEVAVNTVILNGKHQIIVLARDISDRVQAEEKYHNIFENATEGIYQSTPAGNFVHVNPAMAKIYNYSSPEELIDHVKNIGADLFVHSVDWTALIKMLETHGEIRDFHYEARCRDGKKIWISESARAVHDQQHILQYYEGFVEDITVRKQAEIRASIFASLAHQLSTATTPESAGAIIMAMADKLFLYDAFTLDLYSAEQNSIQSVLNIDCVNGKRVSFPPTYSNRPPSARMLKVIQIGGELILRENTSTFLDGAVPFGNTAKPSASIMTVPIRNSEKVIGVLSIQSYAAKAYTFKDLEILQSLADHCGGALERIKVMDALIESESKYREVVENASDIIFSLDKQGSFTYANGAAIKASEYTLEELKNLHYLNLILPEHKYRINRIYHKQFLEQQTTTYAEFPFKTKSGKVKWFAQNTTLILEMDKIVGFHVIARDITDRKQTEEALQLQTSYFTQLFDDSPASIVVVDNENRVLQANAAFEKFFQFSLDEAKSKPLDELIVPNDLNYEASHLFASVWQGKKVNAETIRKRKDGSLMQVELVGYPIIINKKQMGAFAIYLDISHRKQAEDNLRHSEERYRSLIDSAQDIILTISPQAFISSMNPAFETLTNWKREEWIGKSFTDLIHPQDLSMVIEMFHDVLESGSKGTAEYKIRTLSGEYLDTEFTMTPQRQSGAIVGVLAIARDITARKNMDEHLRQAQKMESIGTLAGGIAHDFNNILGIIMGYVSILEQAQDRERLAMSTDAITKAVRRGADLVRQILTLARKTDVTLEPVCVNTTINELSKMLRDTFPKTIDITLDLDRKNPFISISPAQLTQSLLNLCVNARDAMDNKGKLKITTQLTPRARLGGLLKHPKAHDYILIQVADSGMGMDEETKQRIFEPFFTTKERGKGTGLGLAVVYGVVQNAGGFITVDSEPGKGTSFNLYFPHFTLTEQCSQEPKEQLSELPQGSETILVVEDEEPLMHLLSTVLVSRGFKVLRAKNGIEAVDIYNSMKESIACIISDLGLPKLGGAESIAKIKTINPKVRVIVASGYLEPTVKSDLISMGVHEFIQKPYEPREILKKVRKIIDYSPSKDLTPTN